MSEGKKLKFQSKVVKFGSHSITLFSIDGVTWSTRRDELKRILERHELERLGLANLKDPSGGAKAKAAKASKKAKTGSDAGDDDVKEVTEDEDESEDVSDDDIESKIVETAAIEVEEPEYNTIVPGTIKDESPRLVALDKQIDKMLGLDNIVALQRKEEPRSDRKPFIKGKITKPEVKKTAPAKKVASPVPGKVKVAAKVAAPVAKKIAKKPQKVIAPKKRATSKPLPKAKRQKTKVRGRSR